MPVGDTSTGEMMANFEPIVRPARTPAQARRLHEQTERLACPSFDFVTELADSFADAASALAHYHPHLPHRNEKPAAEPGGLHVTPAE
jgi:hypothetical protein